MLPTYLNNVGLTIGRSWQIYKICWKLLSLDKELLLFPTILGLVLVLTTAGMFAILDLVAESPAEALAARVGESSQASSTFGLNRYLVLIPFHYANYFIIIYFNAALIGSVLMRLRGGCPSLFDGFRSANSNIIGIVGWALISATVSPVYYIIEKQSRLRVIPYIRIVAIALTILMRGMWSIYTYLVIPALVSECAGPTQAIKRSRALVRKTWGEQLVSRFTFDLGVIIIGMLVGIAAPIIWITTPHPLGQIIAIILWVVVMAPLILFTYTIRSIYVAVLYKYATDGAVPHPFTTEVVKAAWEPRKVPVFG